MLYALTIRAHTCSRDVSVLLLFLSLGGIALGGQEPAGNCDANTAFQHAGQLIGSKQYDQASEVLKQYRTCPYRSPLENFQLGWLYGRARRFGDALEVFEAVPHDVPDPLTHDYAVALSRFELAQYRQAIALLRPYQLSGKADEKTVNLLAVSYSKLGLYRNAYDVLSEEARRQGADLTTYLNLVTVCAEGGDVAKAAEFAAQAKELFPNSADAWIVLGAAETMLGRLDLAFEEFSAAARLAPSRADARFFVALVDYKQGKFSDALSTLRAAVKDGISDSDLHYLIAECLLKLDAANSGQALQELDRAVDLNTNSVAARTLRGKLLVESGHPIEAVFDLEFARNREPDSRAALYNLARAYQAQGRTLEAQALFRQVRSKSTNAVNDVTDTRLNDVLVGKGTQ
jgi:tetratricopeptide (TPR) repeat protein